MFKIVAFDMDGTIADTIPMCIKAFRNSVSPYTDHELGKEEILHTFGLKEIGMVKAVVGRNWESAIEDFYCQYESLCNEVTSVFSGILKLIAFLKKKNVTVALITGKGEKSCTKINCFPISRPMCSVTHFVLIWQVWACISRTCSM